MFVCRMHTHTENWAKHRGRESPEVVIGETKNGQTSRNKERREREAEAEAEAENREGQ